ncbi:MAG: hypothetical protein JWR09_3577, partial [Mucilaginibacter sp.]|nr:hypothetical protein [Mucilaginibacter sp.]
MPNLFRHLIGHSHMHSENLAWGTNYLTPYLVQLLLPPIIIRIN